MAGFLVSPAAALCAIPYRQRSILPLKCFLVIEKYPRQWTASYGAAKMLETIAIILIIGWVLGLVSSYTLGGFIHILLVLAIVVIVLRVLQGRSAL